MLRFAFFVSIAAALEAGLNTTRSGNAQLQLSASTSTSSSSSASPGPGTVSEVTITLISVSSSSTSPSGTGSQAASPTITDGPIYTNECNTDEGRNCDRKPELPYWSGITPGNLVYGFTPTAQRNPWAYFLSFTESNQPPSALSSASSCSVAWYTNYTTWLATADLTFSGIIPASTATSTLVGETVTLENLGSTTGTSTIVNTGTFAVISGGSTTETYTETDYQEVVITSTFIQTATTETLIYSSYTAAFYPSYDWKAQAPCCSACTIYAGQIEVLYFPPATSTAKNQTASVPSTTILSGFTFTSPSIYMALQTLAATDLCGPVGSEITSATTLSFAPDGLSTVPAYSLGGALYTFSPFWQPSPYTAATFGTAGCTSVTTVTGLPEFQNVTVSYNPCFPYISIPTQVQTADPLWTSCTSQWHFVLYDPPYTLSVGEGIGEFSTPSTTTTSIIISPTSPALETTTSSIALTGPTVSPPTVTPTVTPTSSASLEPTTATSTLIPPGSSTNSNPGDPASSSLGVVGPGNGPSSSSTAIPGNQASSSMVQASSSESSPAVIVIGSSTVTADSASRFVIGTTTLTPGGQLTVEGTTIALASNGESLVDTQPPITNIPPTYIIGSQTLSAGGAPITVSGTAYSLAPGVSSVVVGGTTEPISSLLVPSAGASASGLGGIIVTVGGFGTSTSAGPPPSSSLSTPNGTIIAGSAASENAGNVWIWAVMLGASIAVMGYL